MLDGRHVRCQRPLNGGFELTVNIRLRLVDFFNHGFLAAVRGRLGGRERIGLVRPLGTPRHIVPVAKGIHVQDIDVRRLHRHVRRERREHVPRVQVHERCHKVQAKGGRQRNDNDTRTTRREEGLEELADTFGGVKVHRSAATESPNHQVQRIDNDIDLDDTKHHKRSQVRELRSLGTVTQRQNELQQQEPEVGVFDNGVDNGRRSLAKREPSVTIVVAGSTNQIHNNRCSKPVRG